MRAEEWDTPTVIDLINARMSLASGKYMNNIFQDPCTWHVKALMEGGAGLGLFKRHHKSVGFLRKYT